MMAIRTPGGDGVSAAKENRLSFSMSISRRLILSFGIIVVLSWAIGLFAWTINAGIRTDLSQIRHAALEKAEDISTMAEALLALKWHREELLLALRAKAPDTSAVARAISTAEAQFEEGLAGCRRDTDQAIVAASREHRTADVQHLQADALAFDGMEDRFTQVKAAIGQELAAASHAGGAGAPLSNDLDKVSAWVEDYEVEEKSRLAGEVSDIMASLTRSDWMLAILSVVILAASGLFTWFISRTVSHPIHLLKTSAERIGRGEPNVTIELGSRDEFGLLADTLNRMVRDLQSTTVSRDYIDGIFRSMADTLIVVRSDETIQSVNDATVQLLGYPEAELVGQPISLILRLPPGRSRSVIGETLEKGFLTNIDVHYRKRDGGLVPMTLSSSTLKTTSGSAGEVVCVAQDISRRRRAERELEEANRQLVEVSRQAGMAEVATSVLHNVGNVLNSVNVSSTIISDSVRSSKLPNLAKAVELIREQNGNLGAFFESDPKGRQLPGYLVKLAENLALEHEEIRRESESLARNIVHIREVVAMQQNYARVSAVPEPLHIEDLLEDAVRVNLGALERDRVRLVRDLVPGPAALFDKHQLLQILINLIRNAKHACDATGREDKVITLRTRTEEGRVRLAVADNGVGIPPENLTLIFGHGFTTKREGHGFGLHTSAISAKEMGGSLSAASPGPGRGATFTLELPVRQKGKA